jgi:hypothetical protein
MKALRYIIAALALISLISLCTPLRAQSLDLELDEPLEEEFLDEGEEGEFPPEELEEGEEGGLPPEELDEEEDIEGGEAGEGQNSWEISITGAIVMDYIFNNSSDSFTVKYRWEIKGSVNAATAVIKGDATIDAEVEGPLSKWPTGECRLFITIPKIPYELTFRKTNEETSSLRLVFKRTISEDWQSKCTFKDAPDAKFETRGEPERWLTRALEKARPPLKSIVANLGEEETTTTFVINKQILNDPPLGSGEIEGTGVITISPAGN